MSRPVRLQLSRKRGFSLQELSRATNGLEAVNCARPGRWGNPYSIGGTVISGGRDGPTTEGKITPELAVELFRKCVTRIDTPDDFAAGRVTETFVRMFPDIGEIVRSLRGKNLACWCAIDTPHCHAQVLLEIADA